MARFARDCMQKMKVLVVKLEVPLGPGTADLSMRFGLHSGPVTAGVLRGEKSRFQLFGDVSRCYGWVGVQVESNANSQFMILLLTDGQHSGPNGIEWDKGENSC